MQRLPQFTRGHFILFGSAKFIAGLVIGFGLGVYFLPFLTFEKGLSETELAELTSSARPKPIIARASLCATWKARMPPHRGEGTIYVRDDRIWLDGAIAPGPDYRLYLTMGQFTTRDSFLAAKSQACKLRL